jgi:hypothetical protein
MRTLYYVLLLAVISGGCAEKKATVIPTSPLRPQRPRPVKKEPSPVKKEDLPPPTILSPRVGQEEEDRLKQEAKSRIDGAERLVKQIDQNRLVEEQRGTLLTIQSFLSKAREALSLEDFLRAFNLADKAQILALELVNTLR